MTQTHARMPRCTVTLREAEGGGGISSHATWLPLLFLDGVRVRTMGTRGLSMLERFVIIALQELGECSSEDLREIAAIPPDLSKWLLSVMRQRGLATSLNGTVFEPQREACRVALQSNRIPAEREEKRSFLWFPLSDELVLLPESSSLLRRLGNIDPFGRFPIHERWSKEPREKLVRDALYRQCVFGAGPCEIVGVSDDVPLEDQLPAYQCTAILPDEDASEWRLTVLGRRKGKRREKTSDGKAQDNRDVQEVPITIPLLPGLRSLWNAPLDTVRASIHEWLLAKGLKKATFHDRAYRADIDAAAVQSMAQLSLLRSSFSLGVQIEREIEYSLPLIVTPVDEPSRRLFALDEAVRQVISAPKSAEVMHTIQQAGEHDVDAVLTRLWQLKFFRTIYELREREDFADAP